MKDKVKDSAICIEWMHQWKSEEICYDDEDGVYVDHDAWNSKIENTIHRAFQQFADIAFRNALHGRELIVTSVRLKANHCPLPHHRNRGQFLVTFKTKG
jgi:hypothetical protein